MNVLIFGSKGQLATELKKNLKSKKIKFIFIGKKNLNLLLYNQVKTLVKKVKPSIIINCAAYTDVDSSQSNSTIAYDLNCNAVKNIAKICKLLDIYLIHFSTDYVFDGKKFNYSEKDRTNPINVYGKTKKIGEKLITNNLNNFVIFRLSWLIGNYNNNFLKKIYKILINKEKIYMVKDQISNPTLSIFVSQIVNICIENYYNKKNILIGTFHLSNEPAISKLEFTKYVYKNLKKLNLINNNCKIIGISSKELKTLANRPENTSFDLKKIKSKLKIKDFRWKKQIKNILIKL